MAASARLRLPLSPLREVLRQPQAAVRWQCKQLLHSRQPIRSRREHVPDYLYRPNRKADLYDIIWQPLAGWYRSRPSALWALSVQLVKQRRRHKPAISRRKPPEFWISWTLLKREGAGKTGYRLIPAVRVQ